jgi:hypothetical protein
MANEALQRMLEIGKRADNMASAGNRQIAPSTPRMNLEEQLQALDNQVYGKYVPTKEEQEAYSAEAEMERIKNRMNEGRKATVSVNSRVPKKILESFLENPCNLDTELYQDAKMTALTKRLSGKMSGVKNVNEIQKKLDEADREKQKVSESLRPKQIDTNSNVSIDYSLVKNIIESVLEEKLSTVKQSLTETINRNSDDSGSLKVMKMGSKFLFLDDEDNVYECKMQYVGKNKKKKQ